MTSEHETEEEQPINIPLTKTQREFLAYCAECYLNSGSNFIIDDDANYTKTALQKWSRVGIERDFEEAKKITAELSEICKTLKVNPSDYIDWMENLRYVKDWLERTKQETSHGED